MRSFAGLRAEQASTTGSSKGSHGFDSHLIEEGPEGGAGPVLPVFEFVALQARVHSNGTLGRQGGNVQGLGQAQRPVLGFHSLLSFIAPSHTRRSENMPVSTLRMAA